MLEARSRMQEKYNQVANVELERQQERDKQLEEEKRKQKIEEWERLQQGKGYFSKTRAQEVNHLPTEAKKKLKPKDGKNFLSYFRSPNDCKSAPKSLDIMQDKPTSNKVVAAMPAQ